MRTSIATVCVSGTLEEKLEACAAAGFDGVELFEQDLVVCALSPAQVRERAERLGLRLDLYQPFPDLEGVGETAFETNLDRLEAKLALMDELGIDTLLVCSNAGEAPVADDAVIASQLRRAGDLAAAHGKRIAYEALAWGSHVSTYRHSWELVRAADHPAVGVCLDSFHILSRGDDPSGIEDIPGERIFFVQLADGRPQGMEVLAWSRHHRVFPGEGAFDLVDFTVRLLRTGYRGPLSLEVFNDAFRQADPRITAVDAARSLRWLQQRARADVRLDPELRALLSGLEAIEPVEALDHVELVTDRPDALAAVLAGLGFALVGRHPRSSQLLFRGPGESAGAGARTATEAGSGSGTAAEPGVPAETRPSKTPPGETPPGEARIVVSPRADGGTRIASVAVVVADAERAQRRARELGAAPTPRANGGTGGLPGVWAGSRRLAFVDPGLAGWTRGFGAAEDSAARLGCGPSARAGFDHVGFAESRDAFEATALLLESALRLERAAPQDVATLRGLVTAQALESPRRGTRWVLDLLPPALGSAAFPDRLALRVPDALAAARAARDAGVEPLAIPANYYADLAARFGLSEAVLGRWRELGILYDRDAGGELLHFCTPTVGGLAFDVLERVGDYAGWGGADAAVRLAAQWAGERDGARPGAQNG